MSLLVLGRLRPCSQAEAVRWEASNWCLGAPRGQAAGPSICALLNPWGPQWSTQAWLAQGRTQLCSQTLCGLGPGWLFVFSNFSFLVTFSEV